MAQFDGLELSYGTIFIDLLHAGTFHCLGKAQDDSHSSSTLQTSKQSRYPVN